VEQEHLHVIGLGNREELAGRAWQYLLYRGSQRREGHPVFTTPEKVERYVRANFDAPKAHMDMLESVPESHVKPLTEGRYIVMPLDAAGVAQAAAIAGADYLVRDPRPGDEQEILRLT
jgi:hypothetical protein